MKEANLKRIHPVWFQLYDILKKAKLWKDLNDPDNHDGVITHLEPDILESEVKLTLGSIAKSKASGGDGIQLSYFKS